MKRFFAVLTTTLFITQLTLPATANTPVPIPLNTCIDDLAKKLLVIEGKTDDAVHKQVWKLFLNSIDTDRLGGRAYGGLNWRNFGKKERDFALHHYFILLYGKGLEETGEVTDRKATKIEKRLATSPEISAKLGYDVVLVITPDNGRVIFARLLVTPNCKIFDFGNGTAWASRFVEAAEVDKYMREKK